MMTPSVILAISIALTFLEPISLKTHQHGPTCDHSPVNAVAYLEARKAQRKIETSKKEFQNEK